MEPLINTFPENELQYMEPNLIIILQLFVTVPILEHVVGIGFKAYPKAGPIKMIDINFGTLPELSLSFNLV